MAQGNEFRGPLRSHYACQLSHGDGIALRSIPFNKGASGFLWK